jgi:GT2 family glycosyltransferase
MKNGTPEVTIIVVPRERFSVAGAALERLLEVTPQPFHLCVVDCATPSCYRQSIERALRGHPNAEIVYHDGYLRPNQSRNVGVRASKRTEWTCIMDNDVFVDPEWLPRLIRASEEEGADVAVPLIIEGDESGPVHFDYRLGYIRRKAPWITGKWVIKAPRFDYRADRSASRRWQSLIEDHCVLYRGDVLTKITPFEESISTRELIDLSMRLHAAHARIIFEPKARVVFAPPPPVEPEEREFYAFRWDRNQAAYSNEYVAKAWGITGLPRSMNFIEERLSFLEPPVRSSREGR